MGANNDKAELDAFCKLDMIPVLEQMGWTRVAGTKNDWRHGERVVTAVLMKTGNWMARLHRAPTSEQWLNNVKLAQLTEPSLGRVRVILRRTFSTPRPDTDPSAPSSAPPISVSINPSSTPPSATRTYRASAEVVADLKECSAPLQPGDVPSMLKNRGFAEVDAVFLRAIRRSTADRRNLIFPYYGFRDGKLVTCGYETKGMAGFKSYSRDCEAGIWISDLKLADPDLVVICESPIDCMSSRVIRRDEGSVLYIAVRSGAVQHAVDYLERLDVVGRRIPVEVLTDMDPAGLRYAADIMAGCKGARMTYVAPPPGCKDWADKLAEMSVLDGASLDPMP